MAQGNGKGQADVEMMENIVHNNDTEIQKKIMMIIIIIINATGGEYQSYIATLPSECT